VLAQALTQPAETTAVEVGPVLLDLVKPWLAHSTVTVKPVLDLGRMPPVDGYEVPDRLSDAVHAINQAGCFPYGSNTGRALETDHLATVTDYPSQNLAMTIRLTPSPAASPRP
jgi:hypothetical protein